MEAIYFDGKSSKPYKVQISETGDGIHIVFNEEGNHSTKFWKLTDIKPESFNSGDKVILSYGDFPFEKLEITGDDAHSFLEASMENESGIEKLYYLISQANGLRLVLISMGVIISVVYAYIFYISPYIGEKAVNIIPQDIEIKTGEAVYRNMSYLIDKDSINSQLLTDFYKACNFKSEYPVRLTYANNDIVNAFALPGGHIVIYKGLIDKTKCWDELAALMGHELAHVNQRHSFKQLTRSLSSYLILSVLTGDVAGMSSVMLENASQLNQMANSRIHEKEADVVGLDYLQESGIRPQAMMDLFERLLEASILNDEFMDHQQKVEENLEFLSSHPLTRKRIEYIEQLISADSKFNYNAVDILEAHEIWDQLTSQKTNTNDN